MSASCSFLDATVARARNRWLRWGFVTLAVVLGLLAAPAVASAHASLISTTPTDGSHSDESPSELVLQLNEPVTLVDGSAQLIDGDGSRLEFSDVRLDDDDKRIVLVAAEPIPDGAYLATARVVSADTHVVSLSIQFTVGSVTQQGEFATSSDDGIEKYLNYPAKTTTYLGLVLSAGLFLASVWVWRDALRSSRFRIVHRIGAGLLAVGLTGRLLVLVAQQSGGLSDVSSTGAQAVLLTPHGTVMAAAVLASVVAFAVPRPVVLAPYAALAILAVTLGGHGGSAASWPVAFFATLLHVYGITVWLGGVAAIFLVVRGPSRRQRWHRVAAVHVGLVVFAGIVLSLLQVRPLAALWATTYGLVLIAKVLAVAVVLVLGYLTFRRYGRRTLAAEVAVAVVVLALTSVLSSSPPAKDVYTTDISTALDFGSSTVVEVGIDSVRRGPQELTIEYPVGGIRPSVSVDFSSAAANVARLPVSLRSAVVEGDRLVWRSDGLVVPAPGEWKVTVRFDGERGPRVASFFYDAL